MNTQRPLPRRLDDPYADPPTMLGVLTGLLLLAATLAVLVLLWLCAGGVS